MTQGLQFLHMAWFIPALLITVCFAPSETNGAADASLGSCWQIKQRPKNQYCGKPLRIGVTWDKCCSSKSGRSWSTFLPKELDYGNSTNDIRLAGKIWVLKYRNSILNSPPDRCQPCATTCSEVKCGENEQCIMKRGLPKCICSPECHLQHKAPVCGTDGRTYKSECHLLKRSCRKRKRLKIAHSGRCQTCSEVKCGKNKACVLDDLLNAKCTRCPTSCDVSPSRKPFCGTDGVTYYSKCQAKIASCRSGKIVNRAYRGPCQEMASCERVRCWRHESCLTDLLSGEPRCWKCGDYHKCPQTTRHVCATDGRTYQTWCEFRLEACRSGKALDAVPLHKCPKKRRASCTSSSQKDASEKINSVSERNEKRMKESLPTKFEGRKKEAKTYLRKSQNRNKKLSKEKRKRRRRKKDRMMKECPTEAPNLKTE